MRAKRRGRRKHPLTAKQLRFLFGRGILVSHKERARRVVEYKRQRAKRLKKFVGGKRRRGAALSDKLFRMPEQERIRVGVHVGEVGGFSQVRLKGTVLRGAQLAQLDGYLAKNPLKSVTLHPELRDSEGHFAGDHHQGRVRVSAYRVAGKDFGVPLEWGKVGSLSTVASSAELAMQRTFVHEIGHNIIDHLRAKLGRSATESLISPFYNAAERAGRYVSQRAAVNWREYLCETLSADTYHKQELMRRDPSGYKMIQEIRALIED